MAVIKILPRSRPAFRSLIEYILKEGKNESPEIFTQNLRSDSIPGWIDEFIQNEAHRKHQRKHQVYLYHEIVSFSNEELPEKLDPETMRMLAQEYIKLRGSDGVMLGAVHRDKQHVHIHFAVSGLKYRTGTAFRLSKEQMRELKLSFQQFHTQELGLKQSVCEHGRRKPYLKDKEWYALHKAKRDAKKEEISTVIKNCLALAGSKKQFYDLLRDRNLHYYERGGVPAGIEVDEGKFRFSLFGVKAGFLYKLNRDIEKE